MGWQLIVDMHVRVPGNLTVVEAHAISHQVKDAIRGRMPEVYDVHIHIEPARER
jgi:divalent metal cation (Fe/Co/Zn/Cd) transporter